jgi:hypothetical protein
VATRFRRNPAGAFRGACPTIEQSLLRLRQGPARLRQDKKKGDRTPRDCCKRAYAHRDSSGTPRMRVGTEFANLSPRRLDMFLNQEAETMPTALEETTSPIRILRRSSLRRSQFPPLPMRRPSLLDLRLRGDAWIQARADGTLALCFDCWEMTAVEGIALDLPSLNGLLQRIRQRQPRKRSSS